jgi:phage protein U
MPDVSAYTLDDYLSLQTAGEVSPLPIASWQKNPPALHAPVYNSGVNNILYQWGPIQFVVVGLNTHELDHDTETDWAIKEIAGAAIYREWVGENDEQVFFRGRVFPYRIQGMFQLEAMELQRRDGIVNILIRGDGKVMGWFALHKLVRAHTHLSAEGMGQQVAFECVMVRVPVPANDQRISSLWGTVVNPQGLG